MSFRTIMAAALMVLAAQAMPASASASWQEASTVMDHATRDMLAVVEDKTLKQPDHIDQLTGEIEKVISPVVDFPYIAKRVMGKYYRRATPAEMDRFSEVFKKTLLKTYAKAVVSFEFKGYHMVPPNADSPDPNKQVVTVDVDSNNGNTYTLVYYMLKQGDRWTLVNVMVDGINLRLTFKNQFADLYQRYNSVSGVIDGWEAAVSDKKLKGATGSDEG